MAVTTLEVRGLTGKAKNASGSYTLSGQRREGHAIYTQEEGDARGHELSHDGVGTVCTAHSPLQRALSYLGIGPMLVAARSRPRSVTRSGQLAEECPHTVLSCRPSALG
jgi:hypothetical protein